MDRRHDWRGARRARGHGGQTALRLGIVCRRSQALCGDLDVPVVGHPDLAQQVERRGLCVRGMGLHDHRLAVLAHHGRQLAAHRILGLGHAV
ncbi:MAG: hypothetical protein ACK559_38715, partial [bacterium]